MRGRKRDLLPAGGRPRDNDTSHVDLGSRRPVMGRYLDAKTCYSEGLRAPDRPGLSVPVESPFVFKAERLAVASRIAGVADVVRNDREVDALAEDRRVDADGIGASRIVGFHKIGRGDIGIGVGCREDEWVSGLGSFGGWAKRSTSGTRGPCPVSSGCSVQGWCSDRRPIGNRHLRMREADRPSASLAAWPATTSPTSRSQCGARSGSAGVARLECRTPRLWSPASCRRVAHPPQGLFRARVADRFSAQSETVAHPATANPSKPAGSAPGHRRYGGCSEV